MTKAQRAEVELQQAICVARAAVVQFVVLCVVAMQLRGGAFHPVHDYLSELGSFETAGSLHAWLFNGSLIMLGGGLFVMFRALARAMADHVDDLTVCASTGMAAAIAVVFIGLIPLNVSEPGHTFAMALWLLFTVLALVFWADWRRSKNRVAPTSLGKLGVIAIVIYPLAVMFGRGPAVQKVIVAITLLWLVWFSIQLEQTIQSGIIRRWQTPQRKRDRRLRPGRIFVIENPSGGSEVPVDGSSRPEGGID